MDQEMTRKQIRDDWEPGDIVEARDGSRGQWKRGKVVSNDGLCLDVQFEDGNFGGALDYTNVRAVAANRSSKPKTTAPATTGGFSQNPSDSEYTVPVSPEEAEEMHQSEREIDAELGDGVAEELERQMGIRR